MKSVVLCRVSSKEQEETGYSLGAQEKFLNSYREKQGFQLTKLFSISESASGRKQRELFDQMISFVKSNEIKIIICEKVDRLTRNFKDMVMIDEWLEEDENRQVHLVKDSLIMHKNSRSQEKLNWGIRILFAKNYVDNLSEEVKKGQKEKISQGWLPTKPPPGYRTVGESGHKEHIVDDKTASLAKKMFDLYATGNYSIIRLTETMYQEGLRTETGNRVQKSRIGSLLSDPFYVGKNRWNGQITEGKQEHLITDEVFDKVQEILKGKNTPKYSKHDYQFKGLIRCKECNGIISWETHKGIIYGHCNHYRNCTQNIWSKERETDLAIIDGLNQLKLNSPKLTEWIRKALKESHQAEIEYHQSTQVELKQQYDQIQNRLDRLFDEKIDGNLEDSFYKRKLTQYTEEKEAILKTMKNHSDSSDIYRQKCLDVYDLAQNASSSYLNGNPDQKHELINLVFENLKLNQGKLSYSYTKHFGLLYKAVQATNSSKVAKTTPQDTILFELGKKNAESDKNGRILTIRPSLLPRVDSNHGHPPYKCPQLSKRLGLSHLLRLISSKKESGV